MFEPTSEYGWPRERIRLGIGLLLFVFFELTVARQLPGLFVGILLSTGLACLGSAAKALPEVKLRMQIDAITRA